MPAVGVDTLPRMPSAKLKPSYLEVTEETNAINYLEQAHRHILETQNRVFAWKWVAITLHGALYCFAVCAVKGTDPSRVTRTTKKGQERLIVFDEALKRAQRPQWMRQFTNSRVLELSEGERRSIRFLKKTLRNKFAHYIPLHWMLELHGMPQIALDVLRVVEFLAIHSGNVRLGAREARVKRLLAESREVLLNSRLYAEAQQEESLG